MVKRIDLITPVLLGVMCLVSLSTAVWAGDDADETKKTKKAKETKTEAAAVKLFKTGRMVLPVIDAPDLATYIKALAARAGTETPTGSLTNKSLPAPAPVPAGKVARPAFEWLAEAINAKPISLGVDSEARWILNMHGDPLAKFSYAASGGVLCKFHNFFRRKDRDHIWTLANFMFDREMAREVVAARMNMEVIEAVNSNGKKFTAKKPAPPRPADDQWAINQLSISLKKADFPGNTITSLRVRTQVAIRTGITRFLVTTLARKKPVTISQDGVTVTVSPIETSKRAGGEVWNLPVEIRTKYSKPRGLMFHGESIMFLSEDGKVLRRTSWSGSIGKDSYRMTIEIKPHSIDPASTQMAIEYPTGLRILPVDLTFNNVPIRDVQKRPKK